MEHGTRVGFIAGFLGALILVAIMAIMQAAMGAAPMFVGSMQATIGMIGGPALTWIIGALLFAVSGGIWGAIFGALVSHPTIGKGMLFGFLPALWLWLVWAPVLGSPVFFGFNPPQIIMPFIFNVIVWGAFVGWYCRRRFAPAARTAERSRTDAETTNAGPTDARSTEATGATTREQETRRGEREL